MHAIRIHQFGGPEVLALDELPLPEPGPGFEPPAGTAEGLDLSDAEIEGLFPAPHIIRILDAVVERDMPEDVLAQIVGKPLDDVTEEDEAEILRAIGEWRAGA